MKVLKSWLKDFVNINLSDEELAEKLVTLSGFDLESVEKTLGDRIIVGEIKEVKPHPNADRLRLATVYTGKEDLEIVCGAPNIEAGQKVPLATIGAKVGDIEIQKTPIRGVESNGMMCSERELGLGEDHSGIKILSSDAKVGAPASEYLQSEVVFDLEVTPNRGDCLSHIGIAREIAAFTNQNIPSASYGNETGIVDNQTLGVTDKRNEPRNRSTKDDNLSVTINDPDLCSRYMALEIKNVKIATSPEWLQRRLIALGSKPINSVVDITNYIMLDLGQPLHAFDAAKVASKSIIVKRSEGEIFTTLDEKARTLDSDMLIIADSDKPLALAGIMGGLESGVTETTVDIILEAAEFDSKNVRKTSKTLGLVTDASYRFERGIDSGNIEYALQKAAKMIAEIAGGTVAGDIVKAGGEFKPSLLEIPHDKINSTLGLSLPKAEIDTILTSLGFGIDQNSAIIPSWRHDITIWQDLVEEVGRIYGYDKIPEFEVPATKQLEKSLYYTKEFIKDLLVGAGFSEVTNYPFLSEADLKTAGLEAKSLLEVANPVQSENKYLRSSLIPNMLKSIAKNPAFDPILIFEIGNVFSEENEQTRLGVAASGKNAKSAIEKVRNNLIAAARLSQNDIAIMELSRDELTRFKIRKPVVYSFEIPVATFKVDENSLTLKLQDRKRPFRSISLYPAVTRDIAMIIGNDVDPKQLIDEMYAISGNLVLIELFDEFSSPKFGDNKKSLAYHLFLQEMDRTLTDQEADSVMSKITGMLTHKYGAEIR